MRWLILKARSEEPQGHTKNKQQQNHRLRKAR